jgi:uncharacterized protein (DUF2336 family)
MLVKSFLQWMDRAGADERARATGVLAEAWLAGHHGEDSPAEIVAALTFALDDPAPSVRRALAHALADRAEAPRHIVIALAGDLPEVSRLLVARSPVLAEADLIDLAIHARPEVVVAIALRPDVTARIAREIVARGVFEPVLAVVGNGLSEIADADLLAAVDAFGDRPRLREAIQARGDLPAETRHALMLAVAAEAGDLPVLPGARESGATRLPDETLLGATVAIALRSGKGLGNFIAYLRGRGHLTPALLLRSVLGGHLDFLAAALANLCGIDASRARSLLTSRAEAPILAMLRRAQIPGFLQPVLIASAKAAAKVPAPERGVALSLAVIHAAQSACMADGSEEGVRLLALLRRYEAEAARARSRDLAASLRASMLEEAPEALLPPEIGPDMLRLSDGTAGGDGAEDDIIDLTPVVDRRIVRARGFVLDEPIPDLRSVIAEWKAEQEQAGLAAPALPEGRNENEKPGRSRVA